MKHEVESVLGMYVVCSCGFQGVGGYIEFAEHMKEDK